MRRKPNRETLKEFTERAVRATLDGTLIPPTVYIPVNLRKRGPVREREAVTINPKSIEEIDREIALADPSGFLIAVMQGQPIPCFDVVKGTDGTVELQLEMRAPDMLLRTEVAIELMRLRRRAASNGKDKESADYDAMIRGAADGLD